VSPSIDSSLRRFASEAFLAFLGPVSVDRILAASTECFISWQTLFLSYAFKFHTRDIFMYISPSKDGNNEPTEKQLRGTHCDYRNAEPLSDSFAMPFYDFESSAFFLDYLSR